MQAYSYLYIIAPKAIKIKRYCKKIRRDGISVAPFALKYHLSSLK